ncbi:MAG: competence protein CoiA family protein [Alphaproteobacteria bacterium]
MKLHFALVEGIRSNPMKGIVGTCPNCDCQLVAKCGEERIHHWAHRGRRNCDAWHENETQWHRDWKSLFPEEWHEISHKAESGERHIADLKRPDGLVVEIQYSHIDPTERRKREDFYKTVVWIVSGLRLKRGTSGFEKALCGSQLINKKPPIFSASTSDSPLLRKWVSSTKTVFFDFGDHVIANDKLDGVREPLLWRLDPSSSEETALLTPIFKSQIVADITKSEIGQGTTSGLFERIKLPKRPAPRVPDPIPRLGFSRYLANKRIQRSRRRF